MVSRQTVGEYQIRKWPTISPSNDIPSCVVRSTGRRPFPLKHLGHLAFPEPLDEGRMAEYVVFDCEAQRRVEVITYDSAGRIALGAEFGTLVVQSVFDYWNCPQQRTAIAVVERDGGAMQIPVDTLDYRRIDGVSVDEWLEGLTLPCEKELLSQSAQSFWVNCEGEDEPHVKWLGAHLYCFEHVEPIAPDKLVCDNLGKFSAPEAAKGAVGLAGRFDVQIAGQTYDCDCIVTAIPGRRLSEHFFTIAGDLVLIRVFSPTKPTIECDYCSLNGERYWHLWDIVSSTALHSN